MSSQYRPTDSDPIGAAVRTTVRPRMVPHEIEFMLASAIRSEAVYLAAKDRLSDTSLFESDEARYVLLWRASSAALTASNNSLPPDTTTAKEIVASYVAAETASDPTRRYYTAAVERMVQEEGGLLDAVFALPMDQAVEKRGIDLLAKFVTERRIGDPIRRALAGLTNQETIQDPAAIIEILERHSSDISGITVDPGEDAFLDTFESLPPGPKVSTTGIRGLDELMNGGHAPREAYVVLAPSGGGKCLGRGTPILMYDGSIKPVEQVVEGERLMGPDSRPRTVLSTTSGREMLYRVDGIDGSSYVVNESHILSLRVLDKKKRSEPQIVNIPVVEYLRKSKWFKSQAKGYRAAVDFPTKPLPLDPYLFGLWIADGTTTKPQICKPDPEIKQYLDEVAEFFGLTVVDQGGRNKTCPTWTLTTGRRGNRSVNPIVVALRDLGVLKKGKMIPDVYRINDRTNRLKLLAGLLDGDGLLKHHKAGYEFSSISRQIAESTMFVARSLGFHSTMSERTTTCQTGAACQSFRVHISGDCSVIPCRIARKKANPRRQIKDHLVYGITVTPIGVGDYFGFQIDSDSLFMLGDFTVTHNSALVSQIAVEGAKIQSALAAELGPDKAGYWYYFSWELSRDELRARMYGYAAKIHADSFKEDPITRTMGVLSTSADQTTLKPYEFEPYVNSPGNPVMGEKERLRAVNICMSGPNSRLRIVDYSANIGGKAGFGGVDEIARYLHRERSRGRRTAGVVIDYAGLVIKRYREHHRLKPHDEYVLLEGFVNEIRSKVSIPYECPSWVPHQLHGSASKLGPGRVAHHSEARGCQNFADNADFGIQMGNRVMSTGILQIKATKHRRAPGRDDAVMLHFDGRFGVFSDPNQTYIVDPMTHQIVPRDFVGSQTAMSYKPSSGRPNVDPTVGI